MNDQTSVSPKATESMSGQQELTTHGPDNHQRSQRQRNLFSPKNRKTDIFRGYSCGGFNDTELLKRLIKRMTDCYDWHECDDKPCYEDDNNDEIPAGYTYLAQLAAHDLLQNLAPQPRVSLRPGRFARDFRSDRLVLDTIYGGGPAANPSLYMINDTPDRQRCKLRLGLIRPESESGSRHPYPRPGAPALDIPRAACPFLNDSPGAGAPDILIADPRNDDHVIISQMTALFHRFHNAAYDKLDERDKPKTDADIYETFLATRRVVAHVFRAVIKHDLLKRLLDEGVYDYYCKATFPNNFLDKSNSSLVPLEFSHAAFRIGHVMVRFGYKINDRLPQTASIGQVLAQSSARSADEMPLADNWLVDWSRFFDLGDNSPLNLTRRIEPYIRGQLVHGDDFEVPGVPEQGLFFIDLQRGVESGLLTVGKLAEKIDQFLPASVPRSEITKDPAKRKAAFEHWLTASKFGGFKPGKPDTKAISENPPLFLYLLFEAAHDAKGERLGVVGSVILAEVFFSALDTTKHRFEDAEGIKKDLAAVFDGEAPETVPDLFEKLMVLLGGQV